MKQILSKKIFWVAALGYFVDMYDLIIFGVVRIASLKSLGIPAEELLSAGTFILNLQMAGLLCGGFFWGIFGDKYGRMKMLFGSIFLYSLATVLNAYVTTVPSYGICRFIAGFGLAGELGAAVTILSEVLPVSIRGLGSIFIGVAGFLGAMMAAWLGKELPWKTAYLLGGGLGFVLLFLRFQTRESALFLKMSSQTHRGDLRLLLSDRTRVSKYLKCILVGVPILFVSGVLVFFSPEFAEEFGVTATILAGTAIFWSYTGSIVGDLFCGFLTQRLQSRKKAVLIFLSILTLAVGGYFVALVGRSPTMLYAYCFLLGFGNGYWTLYIALIAEQFGTNLRATVATSVPNLVRAMVIPLVMAVQAFKPVGGFLMAPFFIGVACCVLALLSLFSLKDTFARDLDFLEVDSTQSQA